MQSNADQSVDTSCDGTRAAGLPSPNVIRTNNRESERWYDYDDAGTPVKASGGGRSRPNNSSDEWYRHDAGDPSSGSSTPTKSASGPRPGRNDEAKRLALAAGGDPNDWYRHDHQTNGTDEAARTGKRLSPGKDGSGSAANGEAKPLWFASDGVWHGKGADNVETIGKAAAFSPKNRHADPAASAYYRRDKTGTISEWYPHEHEPTPSSGEPQRAVGARRSGPGTEADDIARRLKAESEDWYVYDGPGEGVRAQPQPRAVSPEVRRMQQRTSGDEMKQTLRMNENLRASDAVSSNSDAI